MIFSVCKLVLFMYFFPFSMFVQYFSNNKFVLLSILYFRFFLFYEICGVVKGLICNTFILNQ